MDQKSRIEAARCSLRKLEAFYVSGLIRFHLSSALFQRSLKSGMLLSGVPDYFGRNKISSGGDLSHYSSASLY